jgi:hypothetical protein
MNRRAIFTLGVCLGLHCSGESTLAQDAIARGLTTPRVSGYAEVVVSDKYIDQGFVLEERGPVVQPYLELLGEFYQGDGFITRAALRLTIFSSLQFHNSGRSNQADPIRTFYEFEVKPGVELGLGKLVRFTTSYRRFESPNEFYGSLNSIEFVLAFDDSDLLGAFALNPRATWVLPLGASDAESEEGHYFDFRIEPGFTIGDGARLPVRVLFPMAIGFGDHHHYGGRSFGFASAGVSVVVPLAFLPGSLGKWNIGASATYYRLGAGPAQLTNGGDRDEQRFGGVLSVEF